MNMQINLDKGASGSYYLHEGAKMQMMKDGGHKQKCCEELANCLSPDFFKALADPNRVALLVRLAGGEKEQTVTDVSCCCPIDISVVSRHLGVLRDAGILEAQKRGREVYYSVRVDKLTTLLRNLADALEACCPEGSCIQGRKEDDLEQES
jgi:DNA-binding transcriptional ArsR family regulator